MRCRPPGLSSTAPLAGTRTRSVFTIRPSLTPWSSATAPGMSTAAPTRESSPSPAFSIFMKTEQVPITSGDSRASWPPMAMRGAPEHPAALPQRAASSMSRRVAAAGRPARWRAG